MEDYEKKYEEALERANAKIETYNHLGNASVVKSICEIFPELKESEDEILRKWLIKYFDKVNDVVEVDRKKVIAWLEKQGEKIDVIENFDTEFEKQVSHLIASTINKEYEYTSDFVKWTANTLLNYAKQELEKQGEQKPTWSEENSCYYDDICEILINLINSPKSNVNKDVVQKDLDWLRSVKKSQLKSAWSEEDENMLQKAISTIMYALSIPIGKENDQCFAGSSTISWLKSLKERMKGE